MNTTLHTIIEDYFKITGRPIATLTVDEYIKFQQQCSSLTDQKQFRSIVQKDEGLRHEDSVPNIHEDSVLPFETRKKTEMVQPDLENPVQPDKESLLKLMQSINS